MKADCSVSAFFICTLKKCSAYNRRLFFYDVPVVGKPYLSYIICTQFASSFHFFQLLPLQFSLWLHCNGIRHILSLPSAKCRILRGRNVFSRTLQQVQSPGLNCYLLPIGTSFVRKSAPLELQKYNLSGKIELVLIRRKFYSTGKETELLHRNGYILQEEMAQRWTLKSCYIR